MSGISRIFGTQPATLRPGPLLVIGKSADGMTNGSLEFTCRKGDLSSPLVLNKLAKGTPIATLYPQIATRFGYLTVDSWTSRDNPGGYSIVSVEFKGADVGTGEEGTYTFDSSIVYSRNTSITELPILNNPKFLAAVPSVECREWIRLGMDSVYRRVDSDTIENATTGADVGSLNTDEERWWWDWIVSKGNHTFLEATTEWTKSATGRGPLPDSSFTKIGYKDTPPGKPGTPPGKSWLYTGATESITVAGSGANSYSQTWTSGDWPDELASAPP